MFRSAEGEEEEDGNWVVKAAGRGAQDLSLSPLLLLLLRGGQDKIFAGHKKVRRCWASVWPRDRGHLHPLNHVVSELPTYGLNVIPKTPCH